MKVLIVFGTFDTDNIFVLSLYNKIKELGVDIECDQVKFWTSNTHYDIIHFQWPEEVIGWNCTDISKINELQNRIEHFKKQGTKFVYTRHNICPHYSNKVISEAYKIIESNCDMIVHMGQYSLNEFSSKHPNSHNTIILHHIYENSYDESISKKEARKKLNIPQDKFVITAFGKFRNKEERKMVVNAFYNLKIRNKYLQVPRFFPFHKKPFHANIIKRIISRIAYHLVIPFCRLFHIHGKGVDDLVSHEDLPHYLASSDVIFIQRKSILNSGNVPMAFLFKKIVVGPNAGNVGELLHQTNNPTFNPNDTNSITLAIEKSRELYSNNLGEKNYEFAIKFMGIQHIAEQYIAVYNSLMHQND